MAYSFYCDENNSGLGVRAWNKADSGEVKILFEWDLENTKLAKENKKKGIVTDKVLIK